MRISKFIENYPKLLELSRAVVLVAGPGVGKTDAILTARGLGWDVLLFHPSVSDPTDFKGQPYAFATPEGEAKARHLPYEDLDKLIKADRKTVAFFDDMGQGAPATQAAMMQLFLQREVAGHKISEHVRFMGATNRAEDKAGVASMIEPLKGRCKLLHIETDIDDWCDWAYEQEWMPAEVPSFLRFKTELLNAFVPSRDITNTPTPRNWASLGETVNAGMTDLELLAGDVGQGAASEFLAFREVYMDLPDPDEILKNPETAEVPDKTKPSVMYALMGALSHRSRPGTAEAIVKYLARVPKEMSVLCMKDCFAKNKKGGFKNHASVTKWCLDNQSIMSLA